MTLPVTRDAAREDVLNFALLKAWAREKALHEALHHFVELIRVWRLDAEHAQSLGLVQIAVSADNLLVAYDAIAAYEQAHSAGGIPRWLP